MDVNIANMNMEPVSSILLVVPDTKYSQSVPVVIGTNVLDRMLSKVEEVHGAQYHQRVCLPDAWSMAFRTLKIQSRAVARGKGCLAIVKCAACKNMVIPGNTSMIIQGKIDHRVFSSASLGVAEQLADSSLPEGMTITPVLMNVGADYSPVTIEVSNLSSRPIVIEPSRTMCQIQSCAVETDLPAELPVRELNAALQKIDLNQSRLSEAEKQDVTKILSDWTDNFSANDLDVGLTSAVKHKIILDNYSPFKQRHRRIPPAMYTEVRQHLRQLLDSGVIRKSNSPWASNIVLVRKKDNSLRLCVDYRTLNSRTVNDAYALPRIEEILDGIGGNRFYSILDMKSGYYQVEIEEADKQFTAFTAGPLGFYEYNRLPFGLSNAPATYQRLMEECLGDLVTDEDRICQIYLDDILVGSKTFEEHVERLLQVFSRVREAGLKLSPKKCALFRDRVKYVGHVVSEHGVETDPEKIDKIRNWPIPQNAKQLRTFVGFAGYYRRFVNNFSKVSRPLTQLLLLHPPGKRLKKIKPPAWQWTVDQQKAFDELKEYLSSPPILAYPQYEQPFILHTDASLMGLGALLYQESEGKERVISYASRQLNDAESRYPAHKLEFLVLKWAVTQKFHDYLYGHKFVVFTDNNPLTYVLGKAKLDAIGHRWIAALSAYD